MSIPDRWQFMIVGICIGVLISAGLFGWLDNDRIQGLEADLDQARTDAIVCNYVVENRNGIIEAQREELARMAFTLLPPKLRGIFNETQVLRASRSTGPRQQRPLGWREGKGVLQD